MTAAAPCRLAGRPAAGGLAFGPLHRMSPALSVQSVQPGPTPSLDDALTAARLDIERLVAGETGAARDILRFQLALLCDPQLRGAAAALLAEGRSPGQAWMQATAAEVDGFLASGSEMLQGRAADLADLCRRVLAHLHEGPAARTVPSGHVVIADDLAPSEFLSTDWTGGGLVLRGGSAASHVAVLARARGVPMIVAVSGEDEPGATHALVDGDRGYAVLQRDCSAPCRVASPPPAAPDCTAPSVTADGTAVDVMINVSGFRDLDEVGTAGCDGIGLVRSEFLLGEGDLLSEEGQFACYRRLLAWADGRPVRVRTVDAGADKPVAGLSDMLPGLRGLRLSLGRPEVFKVQLRALARAAAEAGNLAVMFPMVTSPPEFAEARALFAHEVAGLVASRVAARLPPLGAMIEVPGAALAADLFDGAAFFSIGSNDLYHHAMGVRRDEAACGPPAAHDHPAMAMLIRAVVDAGRKLGVPVSVCGDLAADPQKLHWLLSCGVRSLSVAARALGPVRAAVRAAELSGAAAAWSRQG